MCCPQRRPLRRGASLVHLDTHLIVKLPPLMQTSKRMVPYLFVRGDGVILISPPLRT